MNGARNLADLGKLIKYYRQSKDLSQSDLAKIAKTTQVTVSNIENGNGGTIRALIKLVIALEMEINLSQIQKINSKNIAEFLEPS